MYFVGVIGVCPKRRVLSENKLFPDYRHHCVSGLIRLALWQKIRLSYFFLCFCPSKRRTKGLVTFLGFGKGSPVTIRDVWKKKKSYKSPLAATSFRSIGSIQQAPSVIIIVSGSNLRGQWGSLVTHHNGHWKGIIGPENLVWWVTASIVVAWQAWRRDITWERRGQPLGLY